MAFTAGAHGAEQRGSRENGQLRPRGKAHGVTACTASVGYSTEAIINPSGLPPHTGGAEMPIGFGRPGSLPR